MCFALMNFHIVNPLQPLSKVPGTAVHGKCLLHNTRAEISMRLAWLGTRALALPERREKGATEGCTRKKTCSSSAKMAFALQKTSVLMKLDNGFKSESLCQW